MTVPDDILQELRYLKNEVYWARTHWRAWCQLFLEGECIARAVTETAPKFFGVVHRVLSRDIAHTLSRLVDKRRGAVSFEKIWLKAKKLKHGYDWSEWNEEFGKLCSAAEPFREARHGVLAHSDRKIVIGIEETPTGTPEQMSAAVEQATRCLKILSAALDSPVDERNWRHDLDLDRLVEVCKTRGQDSE